MRTGVYVPAMVRAAPAAPGAKVVAAVVTTVRSPTTVAYRVVPNEPASRAGRAMVPTPKPSTNTTAA
jgi:hypothetical protein